MSSVIIGKWSTPFDFSETIIRRNRALLSEEINNVLEYLKIKSGELGEGFREAAETGLKALDDFASELLERYRPGKIKEADPSKFLRKLTDEFNLRAADLKHAIELSKIEQAAAAACVRELKLLRDMIEKHIHNGVIGGALEEFVKLSTQISESLVKNVPENEVPKVQALLMSARLAIKKAGVADMFNNPAGRGKIIKFPAIKKNAGRSPAASDDCAAIKNRIACYHEMIGGIDAGAFDDIDSIVRSSEGEDNVQRLGLICDEVKLRYGQLKQAAAWSEVFRADLIYFRDRAVEYEDHAGIVERIDSLAARKYITNKEYTLIKEAFGGFISARLEERRIRASASEFIRRLAEGLGDLGYEVKTGRPVEGDGNDGERPGKFYIASPHEGYRIAAEVSRETGYLEARIERLVARGAKTAGLSAQQAQKDRDVAEKWCSDFDSAMEKLRDQGIKMEISLRREPAEAGVALVENTGPSNGRENILNFKKRLDIK